MRRGKKIIHKSTSIFLVFVLQKIFFTAFCRFEDFLLAIQTDYCSLELFIIFNTDNFTHSMFFQKNLSKQFVILLFKILTLMKASQFTFSANCVINFDDLGQLKDYTPLVEELVNQLQTEQKADNDKLKEVISADYEDLEHVPKFKHLVSLILSQQKFLEESRSRNFLILILKIMQAHFTSYSIEEELADSIFSFLMKYLGNQRDIAFDFFLYISSVIPYLENHEQLISLFIASFNQKDIFSSGYVQIYLKIVDKLMRNLILRKLFLKQANQDYLYLNFKLSEWAKNNAEMKVFYQRLAEHYGTNEDIVFQKFLAASKVQLL